MLPPPPITTEIVECPSCAHGIDPHGTDPGGKCGVGDGTGHLCECLWSPNDIAAAHSQTARLTARITARIDAAADAAGVPRLRILPIHCRQTGDPSHYVVVDRCRQLDADRAKAAAETLRATIKVPVLVFAWSVDLPDVDPDPEEGIDLSTLPDGCSADHWPGETTPQVSCPGGC